MSHDCYQSLHVAPVREAAMFSILALGLIAGGAGVFSDPTLLGIASAEAANAGGVFNRATYSSPIALSADNILVWSVNPGDESVSVIRTSDNTKIKNIKVGDEPQSVALIPNNAYAYVANAAGSSVSVIKIKNANPSAFDAEVAASALARRHSSASACCRRTTIMAPAKPWRACCRTSTIARPPAPSHSAIFSPTLTSVRKSFDFWKASTSRPPQSLDDRCLRPPPVVGRRLFLPGE